MKAQVKSGGPTPEHVPAPAPVVTVDEEAAAEAVADAAVSADAVDAPVPRRPTLRRPALPTADAPADEPARRRR